MRKKRLMIAIACIILVGIAVIVFFSQQGEKPYKDLDAAQIVSAKVLLTPPDKTIEIENIQELVEYLNDVVVYNEDNSYTEYAGQGVVFTLTMVDGTQTDIMAYNPFIVIDGIGYKTKYEPCEALNSYANELLNSGTANIILEEPPTLSVVSDETAIGAVLGTYSWQKTNIDGTAESTIADSPHPLECKDLLSPPFETTETTATLRFTEDPDTILSVQCWSDEHWGEPATNSEDVTIVACRRERACQRGHCKSRSRSRNIRKDGTERQAQHGRHFRRKACRRSMVQLHQEEAATRTRKLKVQNADPLRFALSHFHDNLRQ